MWHIYRYDKSSRGLIEKVPDRGDVYFLLAQHEPLDLLEHELKRYPISLKTELILVRGVTYLCRYHEDNERSAEVSNTLNNKGDNQITSRARSYATSYLKNILSVRPPIKDSSGKIKRVDLSRKFDNEDLMRVIMEAFMDGARDATEPTFATAVDIFCEGDSQGQTYIYGNTPNPNLFKLEYTVNNDRVWGSFTNNISGAG